MVFEIKKTILEFIKNLVTQITSRAVEIVISPCCKPAFTTVVTCGSGPGLYNVTYTFTGLPNFLGRGLYTVLAGGTALPGGYRPYDDSGIISVTDIPASSGDTGVLFFLPTSNGVLNMSGAFLSIYVGIDLPVCP